MMNVQVTLPTTAEEFDAWVLLPENAGRDWEFIGGEVRDVVSNALSSETAANILVAIGAYAKQHKLGRVTGADGGYMIAGERYMPDVAFISFKRQPQPSQEAYNPTPPELVVEVVSPSDDASITTAKINNYLIAGCIVWHVNPMTRAVFVLEPGKPARSLTMDDVLTGGDILPGFNLPVREIFPESETGS